MSSPVNRKVQEIVDSMVQAGRQQEVAVLGEAAEDEFEGGLLIDFAGFKVTGRHREFVEVGEKTVHPG